MDVQSLPKLLAAAWLLPLASFTLIVFFGPRLGKHGSKAAWVATGAILSSFLLSAISLIIWTTSTPAGEAHAAAHVATAQHDGAEHHDDPHSDDAHGVAGHHHTPPRYISADWYTLGKFGDLEITISYYIDSLTVGMFAMVTLIASCIHFYAAGYMHDELHDITDHEVKLANGHHLHRPGRFHRFFQYLSLFCFSMLGLVIAGNIAMVFVFWELVGICSYFLIGFYIERKSASTAANKAFIANRVGDFGMIIGLMALWGGLGTFAFGDKTDADGHVTSAGIFTKVRAPENDYQLVVPAGMVRDSARAEVAKIVRRHPGDEAAANAEIATQLDTWRADRRHHHGYWLLIVAGLGIFCGCVGKSAQFPLHVWLPDAMEGPTPVSALVHSATMVAAGVYLVGRFYPVFTPEVLYVIAWVGAITLLLAATIAITATDIKRVLAYSTVSQLGYMMLALGVGGWVAGLFHLITHAFFKSLLFMCSGSVIHACHTNEMPKMGGLRRKMPYTAYTMLVGCLAIAGAGIPFTPIGLSGFFSKDSILAQAWLFNTSNSAHYPWAGVLFYVAAAGAAITAFYMFRLWFMTFAGEPRDHHIYDHAHESPKIMYVPLIILAVFAAVIGWPWLGVTSLLEQARPAGILGESHGVLLPLTYPDEHASHVGAPHTVASIVATITALTGFTLALLFYGLNKLNPNTVKNSLKPAYVLLRNKWYFDELYNVTFIQPTLFLSRRISDFDRYVIDWIIDRTAIAVRGLANLDDLIDRYLVDGAVNLVAKWTFAAGVSLRNIQTGNLRQYVMFIVVGTVALFVLMSYWRTVLAG